MRKLMDLRKDPRATVAAIIAAFIALLLVIWLVFKVGRGRNEKETTNMAIFEPYIAAYTAGVIPRTASIQVVLAQDPKEPAKAGEKAHSTLLKISPAIKGEITWINKRTLEFTPAEGFKSGTEYKITVPIGKLFDNVPREAERFTFSVRILRQSLSLFSADYYIGNAVESSGAIQGELQTADAMPAEQLEKMVFINVDGGRKLNVHLASTDNPRVFSFTSDPIPHGSKHATVQFSPGKEDIDGFADRKVILPTNEAFSVLNWYVDDRESQSIRVVFSQALDKQHYQEGFMYCEGMIDPRYKIDGNLLTIFPSNDLKGTYTLVLENVIRSVKGATLDKTTECKVTFSGRDPEVDFLKNGYILPAVGKVQIPIKTVGLRAVDITVYKIFRSNLLYSFQEEYAFEYGDGLQRVGKLLFRKTIPLDTMKGNQSAVYTLDLTSLVEMEPGAMYRIGLSMRKELATADKTPLAEVMLKTDNYEEWGYESDYQTYMDYNWRDQNDPTTDSYYRYKGFTWRNVLVSNIGIIAKRDKANGIYSYTTNLTEGTPLSGAKVKLYSYQLQELASSTTDGDGFALLKYPEREDPFLIVAEMEGSQSLLNVRGASSRLSYSTFKTDGIESQKGLQGFFYGDRGVWRPGDSIFMTLMVEDRLARLPEHHPVEFILRSPRGQIIDRQVQQGNRMKIYTLRTATSPDAETGRYSLEARVGGTSFREKVRVETIKPNRLKVALSLGEKILRAGAVTPAQLSSAWLHGATASKLAATVDGVFTQQEIPFESYEQYNFSDVANGSVSSERQLFSGNLDENGLANFSLAVPQLKMNNRVKILLRSRVYEPGGGYSVNTSDAIYSPYARYVGLQVPAHDSYFLETNKDQTFKVIVLSADGKPKSNVQLEAKVYKVNWSWWWEHDDVSLAVYLSSKRAELVEGPIALTTDGSGTSKFNVRINHPAWGRYLVRVSDVNGGHVSSQFVYWDWPSQYERDASRYGEDAKILTFESDQPKYEVGERATLRIPTSQGGKLLVAIENSESVVHSVWAEAKKGSTEVTFDITEEMVPNAYANVALLQPYGQSANDLPLRMYGAIPIAVENKNSRITPVLKLPNEARPKSEFTAEVHEKNGVPMGFTLAVVDEGLLDITGFSTPDPWEYFHRKRALGVETYDFYDDIMGAYAGRITGVLNVGGGEEGTKGEAKPRANRFEPVVRFYGPYQLGRNESKKVKVQMPNYVGSVRIMVVAKNEKAQGSTDATLAVRNPLMVQPTLPRVLGINEQIDLPVAVFAMDNKIRNVAVKIECNDLLIAENREQTVTFNAQGDKIIRFPLRTSEKTGIGVVKVTASGNGETTTAELEIDVRNPNPRVVHTTTEIVAQGKSGKLNYSSLDNYSDPQGTVEVNRFPSINYSRLLQYAERYPYDGLEQRTTRAVVQMLYGDLVALDDGMRRELAAKVQEHIGNLQRYQTALGGFSQWPGYSREDYWTTSYVGHFLIEARARGYSVPNGLLSKWQSYQRQIANAWSITRAKDDPALQQAYRLYTLARAGQAQLGAMNRLRSLETLPTAAARRLGTAFLAAGNEKVGKELLQRQENTAKENVFESYSCYGSDLRNHAMLLEELSEFGALTQALTLLEVITTKLASETWLTSQEIGFAMLGTTKFAKAANANTANIKGTVTIDNKKHTLKGNAPSYIVPFTPKTSGTGSVSYSNEGEGTTFVTLVTSGVHTGSLESETANNLSISVKYVTLNGTVLSPTQLQQGTDFKIVVSVNNPGYKGYLDQLALEVPMPAGWEIRLASIEGTASSSQSGYYYQDQRDDRVLTYFNLPDGATKQFTFDVNASYAGQFVLPAISCRSMYDRDVSASTAGKIVRVVAR